MKIGKNVENNDEIEFSDEKSRRILICGKTGSGKSYTMGVLLEELADKTDVFTIVIDPQGIFWTMVNPNNSQETNLWDWNLSPTGFRINLLIPGDPIERYGNIRIVEKLKEMDVNMTSLKINPSDLTNEMWCDLFGLDISDLMGTCLHKAVKSARSKLGKEFMISDIIKEVEKQKTHEKTIEAVLRKLDIATEWDIFELIKYKEIEELLDLSSINVLDLQPLEQSRYGLRNLVVAVLSKFIFRQRSVARRMEALNLDSDMKKVWLAIDEAHNFCPSGKSTLSKEIITRWAKEGRQPGLSLIVASQQPSAI
ncbi:MAG: ATP-binding protein, partial [Candidatus Hodarchaeota archaeon]